MALLPYHSAGRCLLLEADMSFVAVYLGLALSVIILMAIDLNLKNGIFQ
jgi:hypothetical protein